MEGRGSRRKGENNIGHPSRNLAEYQEGCYPSSPAGSKGGKEELRHKTDSSGVRGEKVNLAIRNRGAPEKMALLLEKVSDSQLPHRGSRRSSS